MLEPETEETAGFTETMQVLKEQDRELYETLAHRLDFKTWGPMLRRLKKHDRQEFNDLNENLAALRAPASLRVPAASYHRRKDAKRVLHRIAKKIAQTYDCDAGFREEGPVVKTVTVRLKHPGVITGLPVEVMEQSNRLAKDFGGKRKWTFGFDNRVFVADLTEEAIAEMEKLDEVESVTIEPMARIMSSEIPTYNPAAVNTDWGVDRCYPTNAWAKGLKGEGVNLCVIDTGIKSDHIAFWHNGETNFKGGWNFVAGDNDPTDDQDHGTYCSGIIGHRHTGVNGHYRGLAPNINLYVCKALDSKGSGSLANIAAAIDWARTHGMHIVSMSLGGPSDSATLKAACDAAWYADLVLCAATGNDGSAVSISYPAKYQSVIAVPAADYSDNIAAFSNKGPEAEITGPGVAIVGPWAGFTYESYVVENSNDLYMCASGTSAACPHVAACAALVKQWYPSITNVALREWLRIHSRDL
jgi:subtilisin family serine protease